MTGRNWSVTYVRQKAICKQRCNQNFFDFVTKSHNNKNLYFQIVKEKKFCFASIKMIWTLESCNPIISNVLLSILKFKVELVGVGLYHLSSEMEAELEGITLGEGSSQEDWKNLFTKCSDAREIILDSVGLESALACRLVCSDWRLTVDFYKKLWAKIYKVSLVAANLWAVTF